MFRHTTLALCLALAGLATVGLSGCRGGFGGSEAELTTSAREYIEKRDHRAAAIQLKNLLRENPDHAEARMLLGRALIIGGEPAAALVELRKAQELKMPDHEVVPDIARAMLALGEETKLIETYANTKLEEPRGAADLLTSLSTAYALKGETAKATEAALAALRAKPDFAPASVMQAQLLASQSKHDEALAVLDATLKTHPNDERAGVLRGEILWRVKKDYAGAEAALRKVLEKTPWSLGANTALIGMLAQQGKLKESRAQFEHLKKEDPNNPETLFFEAQIAFSEQKYRVTREITDRLLKVMPQNVRVLELAGASEFRLGQFGPAESFLTQAIKGAPTLYSARQLLAQSYLRSGQPAKAVETLQFQIDQGQADGTAWSLLAEAHLQLGDTKKADAAFQNAAKAEPDNPRVQTTVAMAQVNRGNFAAVGELERIAAADRGTRADMALISARLRQGDLAGALKAIDGLQAKTPDRAMPLGLRGQVLLRKRDEEGARKAFEQALQKEPTYFPAVASLGALDLAAGKPEAARARFQAFSKANPTNHQGLLAEAELAARIGAPVQEVTRLAREAVKVNPTEPTARMVLVEQLITSGEHEAAVVAAQEALVVLPQNPDIIETLGRAQLAARDGTQAVTTFKRLTALQPTNARLQIRLAEALIAAKDMAGAQQALKRALEIQPDYLPAQRGLVTLALLDKRPDDALKAAKVLQTQRPKEAIGWVAEGDVEAARRNWDAAASAFRAGLQRTKSSETAIKLHSALLNGSKRADADRFSSEWTKDNPRDAAFRFYLGDMAMARGEDAAAEALYRSVLDIQPANALAMNNVAWLMVKQGKSGALPLAEKAVTLLADRAPLLDTLAAAQAAANQLDKAIETQKRAVALDPDNPQLRLSLARHYVKAGEKAYARAELETLARLGDKFGSQGEVSALLKSL